MRRAMRRLALADKRPYLLLSLAAAFLYYYLRVSELPEFYVIPIKGAACAFLAIYALVRHSSRDAKLVAAMMALAALGDMAVDVDLYVGAGLFFLHHIVAVVLYVTHRRAALTGSQKAAVVALLFGPPIIAQLMLADQWVSLYAASLAIMAAAAWASSFPRYRVGAGAVLFVVSDLLIFAGLGPLAGTFAPEYLVWPIYYLGQFLICTGIIQTLRKRDPELRVVARRD